MQVVMNKCFLLNPETNFAQIHLVVFEKNALQFLKMTSTSRRLGYSNKQLHCSQAESRFQAFGNHLIKVVSESLKLTLTC